MDYEKKYKEDFERARKSYIEYNKQLDSFENKNSTDALLLTGSIIALKLQYPELAMSEDEIIYNEILDCFKGMKADKWITWLEKHKQGSDKDKNFIDEACSLIKNIKGK